jgi:UDP-glucose 4-epimerase
VESARPPHSSSLAGRDALIAGGLGFIGSNLAHRLVQEGARVTIVDSLISDNGGNLFNIAGLEDRVVISRVDMRDSAQMSELVRGKHFIFNLAGQSSHLDSIRDPQRDLELNCGAQLSLLEVCRMHNRDCRIVLASTRQVYGRPRYYPVDERHPVNPVDVNGINKLAGESYHDLYWRVHGIRYSALRLTNTLGPRMRVKDARQMFVGDWIRCVMKGDPFRVWDGTQLRDFTYVDDVVEALLRAAESDAAVGEVFNLGGDRVVSLLELAQLLVQLHGSGSYEVIEYPADRKRIDIGSYYADGSKARELLGWQPSVRLEDGLGATLEFYRANLERYL